MLIEFNTLLFIDFSVSKKGGTLAANRYNFLFLRNKTVKSSRTAFLAGLHSEHVLETEMERLQIGKQ